MKKNIFFLFSLILLSSCSYHREVVATLGSDTKVFVLRDQNNMPLSMGIGIVENSIESKKTISETNVPTSHYKIKQPDNTNNLNNKADKAFYLQNRISNIYSHKNHHKIERNLVSIQNNIDLIQLDKINNDPYLQNHKIVKNSPYKQAHKALVIITCSILALLFIILIELVVALGKSFSE